MTKAEQEIEGKLERIRRETEGLHPRADFSARLQESLAKLGKESSAPSLGKRDMSAASRSVRAAGAQGSLRQIEGWGRKALVAAALAAAAAFALAQSQESTLDESWVVNEYEGEIDW